MTIVEELKEKEETEYKPKGMLEKIVLGGLKSRERLTKKGYLKYGVYYPFVFTPGFYFGGMIAESRGQDVVAESLGMGKKAGGELTIKHSIYIGIAGMTLECAALAYFGEDVISATVPKSISTLANIGYNAAIFLYWSVGGIAQNIARIKYVNKTGKGIGSVGLFSIPFNLIVYGSVLGKIGVDAIKEKRAEKKNI